MESDNITTDAATDKPRSIFADGEEETLKRFWSAKPFPHLWIDNYLPEEQYRALAEQNRAADKKSDFQFKTALEKNKTTYSDDSASEEGRSLASLLTTSAFVADLAKLTGVEKITPLTEYKDTVMRFFHRMEDGGILGSHVDHSTVQNGQVHFMNSIFYGPETWESDWGGHTQLFGKWGFKEQARVECKPNRLLIFLHTSQSFHGVSRLTGNTCSRPTVYMDYYVPLNDLQKLNEQSARCGSDFMCKFWKHYTTFVPLTLKDCHRYLHAYLYYLLKRKY
jgi:hypothetical protein